MALPIQSGRGLPVAAAQSGKFNDRRQTVYQQSQAMQYNVRMQQNSPQPMAGSLTPRSTSGQMMRSNVMQRNPSIPVASQVRATMPQQQNTSIKSNNAIGTPVQQPMKRDSRSSSRSKSRKKKMADRILSQKIRDVVPESKAYMDLLEFETKLDTTIMRKRLDIQEALKRPIKEKRTLRLFISHDFIIDEATVPSWEMKIEGKILDDNQGKSTKRKLSSFFKSLLIELDKDLYGPDNHIIEWHRSSTATDTAGFQIKRPGDTAVQCTLILNLDNQIPQYKLDARLSRLLGIHTQTRAVHKLQDQNEREIINNDKYLHQIFEVPRMKFNEIPQRLNGLLHPPDPVVIKYCISPDTPDEKRTTCCDVEVEVDDTLREQMQTFLLSTQSQQEISQLDDKIGTIVQAINDLKVKREFMVNFANDPQAFIHEWLLSQCRDLKIMEGIAGNIEDERKSKYYYQPWAQEAVCRYLYSKVQERRVELETALGIRSS
ncbi:SWI/SNF-related matrix-associated actin-dependent regulator of chromatin subfamily D member 1 [Trichoplax sp. H2]|nr:SWI/SNF-related matrix-associated actin-dependent regulator of chromatin subfamily D member 1 [Trichoplax sp. H2]|eukprot:RDD40204.1 SWI/SNF-related matrix-associated actin-dependent regulator of chromatin subfamily D member 1 [Trichoplax sp. H2]